MSRSEPRVLLSAYQCGPEMGSVSQIGWEWFRRLSARLPTTLVTHVRNRAAIEAANAPGTGEVVYVDTERFAGPLHAWAKRLFPRSEHASFLVSSLDFFPYDVLAVREARRRWRAGARWDLVHQVTPVSPYAPSRLHTLGIPFVLGPLNGGLRDPPGFAEVMRQESSWLHPLRHVARLVDLGWGSSRNASLFLAATRATRESLPARHRERCQILAENAVDPERFREAPWPEPPSEAKPLLVLFVGRLVPAKGVPMLLEALDRVGREREVRLRIVGDGPMRRPWEKMAADRGLGAAVRFTGALSLDQVAEEMRRTHVLCLPSVRESGGAVLLEAMATGRPVVAVAYGGPAEVVSEVVGRAIPPAGPEAVVAGIAEALLEVSRNPAAWREKGEAGRRLVRARYTWDAKIDAVLGIYDRLLAAKATGPGVAAAGAAAARAVREGA